MNPILALLPMAVAVCFHAACLRLSARILGRSQIAWKHALAFAAIMGLLAIVGRGVVMKHGSGVPLPFSLFLAFATQLVLGGWFFSTRARGANGQPVGWRRAVEVMTLALVLLSAAALLLTAVARTLVPVHP